MPLAETYGESSEALQYLISGLNARLFDNDFEASNAYYDAAIETDPGFVMAWYARAVNLVESGDLIEVAAERERLCEQPKSM